jgi:hypothetical protein
MEVSELDGIVRIIVKSVYINFVRCFALAYVLSLFNFDAD